VCAQVVTLGANSRPRLGLPQTVAGDPQGPLDRRGGIDTRVQTGRARWTPREASVRIGSVRSTYFSQIEKVCWNRVAAGKEGLMKISRGCEY
jgi:hypothetical protein